MRAVQRDIVIIGGGPAGTSTALHLARLAPELTARIVILERDRYPRQKLCAGALSPDAEEVLVHLGLDITEIPHLDVVKARLDFGGSGMKVSLPGSHSLRIIQRQEFDAWLARKVGSQGIEVRDGVRVRAVRPGPNCVVVETDAGSIEASLVVGADGSNGVTRTSVLPDSHIHRARVLEIVAPLIRSATQGNAASAGSTQPSGALPAKSADPIGAHLEEVAYADFFPVPQGISGYTWDSPTQVDGVPMRCWGIYDANIHAGSSRTSLKGLLADEMRRNGYNLQDYSLQGHPIQWFSLVGQLSVPRVILVGDAAGVDGILGGGISFALGYGEFAAAYIRDAVTKEDLSFADYRRRLLLSPLGRALVIRTLVTHVLYRLRWSWFQKVLWRVFSPAALFVASRLVANWSKDMEPPGAASLRRAAT